MFQNILTRIITYLLLVCYERMADMNFDFQYKLGCELGGIKINYLAIYQALNFHVFAENNGCFLCSLVFSDLRSETKGS